MLEDTQLTRRRRRGRGSVPVEGGTRKPTAFPKEKINFESVCAPGCLCVEAIASAKALSSKARDTGAVRQKVGAWTAATSRCPVFPSFISWRNHGPGGGPDVTAAEGRLVSVVLAVVTEGCQTPAPWKGPGARPSEPLPSSGRETQVQHVVKLS